MNSAHSFHLNIMCRNPKTRAMHVIPVRQTHCRLLLVKKDLDPNAELRYVAYKSSRVDWRSWGCGSWGMELDQVGQVGPSWQTTDGLKEANSHTSTLEQQQQRMTWIGGILWVKLEPNKHEERDKQLELASS